MRTRVFALGACLSIVDAGFTLTLAGTFYEVNPVLRPMLATPALFLLAKSMFTVGGMGCLARASAPAADALLMLAVVAYTALDGYWIVHALG